jgi:putative glycosyltransferase (TIGR04372 family)
MKNADIKKIFSIILISPLLVLFLPIVIIIRVIGFWRILRIGPHISHRIGHFAGNTEVYLCEKDAGYYKPSKSFMDLFYYHYPISNQFLKKMWDRTIRSIPIDLSLIDKLNRKLPGGKPYAIPMPHFDRDYYGLMAKTDPHLSFTEEEELAGQAGLRDLGIPENTPFVCFHARDSAYLKKMTPNFDSSYHDYRDSNINNYIAGAEELARRGMYAIRMGAVVTEKIASSQKGVIDYAASGKRSDFMDIYLGAKCAFFISSGTGIDAIPMIFRRVSAFVNFVPLEYGRFWQPGHLFIPKKHWLIKDKRFMKFREIIDSGAGRFVYAKQYREHDIELIENTPEEIAELVIEMDERLKGTWKERDENDEELQKQFWQVVKPSNLNSVFSARIGASFLRKNRELL